MSLIKTIYRKRIKTCVFDLVMREPGSIRERFFARIKRRLLRSVDAFIFIHRDTSGYERAYGISREKCVYVPFKANNFDLAKSLVSMDGDYALALGTSQRDYRLLVDAADDLPIRLKIVAPQASVSTHGARLADSLPPNIERIDRSVDRIEWNTLIAQSRFVVIPILPGVLQPAGISVYLEAMMLGKPVIITRGTSTEGILDDNLALLVRPGDVDALRRAITRLWNDPVLRSVLSENGKRYALSLGNHDRLLTDLRSAIQREYAHAESSRQRHR
jgi:glycosyltransferase involved in cell wall biosynthesis